MAQAASSELTTRDPDAAAAEVEVEAEAEACRRLEIARVAVDQHEVKVTAGDTEFDAVVRIDTPGEADYYRHGGIMQYVLRNLLKS